jgi:diguanylate cyclase (GGDEF)-like protein
MSSEAKLSGVLTEFAHTMVTDFPIQAILDHLVERIVDLMPITGAGVTLISPGEVPRYVAASDDLALRFEELQTELAEGPCLAAYSTGEAVAVSDLRTEGRFPNFAPRALKAGLAAVFTFPLRHGDNQLGALDLYRNTPGPLDSRGMTEAQTLADVAASYLLNAQARADLQESSDRSREASLHDSLTGLPNRALILERLDHASLRSQRSGKTSAVLFIDLDHFKVVNDTYGHDVGDELLVAVGKRLSGLLRPGDTVGRLSGDEFVILCEDLDAQAQASAIVARVGAALARPFILLRTEVAMTASVGVAFGDRNDTAFERLLHDADIAMYEAKRKGGARHQILDNHEQRLLERYASLERDLRWASGRGELHTDYQPIVDTTDGRITGVEALVRWMHPTRGLVEPTTLIPLAEQSGLIAEVGQWVLAQAWADRQGWQGENQDDNLGMSVNVSAYQLMSDNFVSDVASVLASGHTDPHLLTLEVTESVFVRDSERALVVLNELKDVGVELALDDFGTGYSSLSYLKEFPVDIVKVDQAFVADIGQDTASSTIIGAVIQLAHDLGMSVVAEGVETAEQHHEIARLRGDSCQGFYFARPMPVTHLDSLLRHPIDEIGPRLPVIAELMATTS